MSDDKKIPGKRRRRCNICNFLKYDVAKVVKPYDEDVKGIKHEEPICMDCYTNIQDDI